jgi:hypothetical protein
VFIHAYMQQPLQPSLPRGKCYIVFRNANLGCIQWVNTRNRIHNNSFSS